MEVRSIENVAKNILSWEWTKTLVYWIVISAGTLSEGAFLVSSLWVTLNASVHPLFRLVLTEELTIHLTELATAAFVGLPECILALAITTTYSHARTYLYDRKAYSGSLFWSIAYGLPTLVFLVLSIGTIGASMLHVGFTLPDWMVVTRGLAGYVYGIVAILYWCIGLPQERDRLKEKDEAYALLRQQSENDLQSLRKEKDDFIHRLQTEHARILAELRDEKDDFISRLRNENTSNLANLGGDKDRIIAQLRGDNQSLNVRLESINRELQQLKEQLTESKNEKQQLITAINKGSEEALQAYSSECISWLKSGVKTATIEDITRYTGHSKRKVETAIERGLLGKSTRNKDLILMNSLVMWLKNNPPSTSKADGETPHLHIVNG